MECKIDNLIFDEMIESPATFPKFATQIRLVDTFLSLITPPPPSNPPVIELCGKFKNTRLVFEWRHIQNKQQENHQHDGPIRPDTLVIEMDETEYDFGTAYELEGTLSLDNNTESLLDVRV